MLLFQVSTTSSNSSRTLNPEAHEFKYKKSLPENQSKSEVLSQDNSRNEKKCKGKYD